MGSPLISVLMPVRQPGPYTQLAIDSVLAQTHRNIELVLIGQADTDDMLSGLSVDSRVIGGPRNSAGIVSALNTGLSLCSGDFIARMDDDDICEPGRLQQQLDYAIANPAISLIGGQVTFFADGGAGYDDADGANPIIGSNHCASQAVGLGNRRYQHWLNELTEPAQLQQSCFIESVIPHPTFFAHRQFWDKIGPYRNTDGPEDYDLVLRAWLGGFAMGKPNGTLLHWREHPARLSRTDARYSREAFVQTKVRILMQPESGMQLYDGRTVWICGTGRNARYWHDALVGHGVQVNGFVDLDHPARKASKRHLPVITYNELLRVWKQSLVITAITDATARQKLQSWFSDNAKRAYVDFVLGG